MKFSDLSAPGGERELLAVPPLSEYGRIIEANRALARGIDIAGTPLPALAAQARREAVGAALDYTRGLGLDPGPAPDPEGPIIGSGHQPVVFHPGLAVKACALARLARAGNGVIFFSVDCDEFKESQPPVPAVENGRLAKRRADLFPQEGKAIFETAAVEPAARLLERLGRVRDELSVEPRLAEPARALSRYLDKIGVEGLDGMDFTARAVFMRRKWLAERADRLPELPVSRLCAGGPFTAFSRDILQNIERFTGIYNGQLARYRKERKLRYKANPFPDLDETNGLFEAPFWVIGGLGREKLYVRPAGDGKVFLFGARTGQFGFEDIERGKVGIRPRAITLSIFLRLFVCDLFIHGVGGSKYDIVTDRIIEEYYGIDAPAYSCMSASVWIGVPAADPRERMDKIRERLRWLDSHPEKSAATDPQFASLAAEKASLLEAIRAPGADKKKLGGRISELNEAMGEFLKPEKESLMRELEELEKKEEERVAAQARDYPYFFHLPEVVCGLLNG